MGRNTLISTINVYEDVARGFGGEVDSYQYLVNAYLKDQKRFGERFKALLTTQKSLPEFAGQPDIDLLRKDGRIHSIEMSPLPPGWAIRVYCSKDKIEELKTLLPAEFHGVPVDITLSK